MSNLWENLAQYYGNAAGNGNNNNITTGAWGMDTGNADALANYTPEQQTLFNQMMYNMTHGQGGNTSWFGNQPAPSMPGFNYVPETYYDKRFIGYQNQNPQRTTAINSLLRGTPAYDVNTEATRNYWENTLAPIQRQTFQEETLPMLRESFAGPGYWSSRRADAESDAIQNFGRDMAAQESNLYYQDELARRQALESAANRIGTGIQGSVSDQEMRGEAAAYARQVRQEEVAADIQRWLSGEALPRADGTMAWNPTNNPQTQLALAMLGLSPFSYASDNDSNWYDSILGGAGGGIGQGLGMGLMSLLG